MLMLTAALMLAATPTPPPVLIGGPQPDTTHAREWSVSRPSRGAHAAVVRRASTIPPRLRPWAACVSDRESSGSYTARNPTSSASGRWQLLDSQWRVNGGIHYIVARRLTAFGMPRTQVKAVRQYLHRTPIHRWPGPFQDAAFVQIVEEGGAHHWRGPGCGQP